jgi:glucans biosynthesis protein
MSHHHSRFPRLTRNPYSFASVVLACAAIPLVGPLSSAAPDAPRTPAHPATTASKHAFGFEDVKQAAERLEHGTYAAPNSTLPEAIAHLSYDQYRDIRFKAQSALWRKDDSPFEVQFFHLGSYFTTPVEVNVVRDDGVVPVRYRASMFDFGRNQVDAETLGAAGFAGLRVHYPLNTDNYKDELLTFLGASYFRVLGRSAVYGASARGLAIDTAMAGGEEFPQFRTFWLVQPVHGDRQLTLYALLDSRSITGAYRFIVHPGDTTTVDVTATLFAREQVQTLGIAPLTSMYLCGGNTGGCSDDYRSEVHDSDGLALWLGNGEELYRPLDDPERLSLASFDAPSLKGFGLAQRNRDFATYEDLESHFERRPDVFVEPVGDWGGGHVSLLELPTPKEIHDNITAFFTPNAPLAKGGSLTVAYRMYWGVAVPELHRPGRTLSTHSGAGSARGFRRFVVDFAGGRDARAGAHVEPVVTASRGKIVNSFAERNDVTHGWRVSFEVVPEGGESVELRCFARAGLDTLTETWSYLWNSRTERTALR